MSMNDTPSGERRQIGLFGKRNVGKSSLINAITGQKLAVVSEVKGTTTDPVKKAMELLPLGPVVFIDTPGFDDEGKLGDERMEKTKEIFRQIDLAVLVIDVNSKDFSIEKEIVKNMKKRQLPVLICVNKTDNLPDSQEREIALQVKEALAVKGENIVCVSAKENIGIHGLKEKVAELLTEEDEDRPLVCDLVEAGDFVLLVVPIDKAAPKGRLILPQQQVIRDALDAGAIPVVCRETEIVDTLQGIGKKPRLAVTDSQVFKTVSKKLPEEIPLTSFSILMARYKGDLPTQIAGAKAIDYLKDGDKILISEGCTHHRQCGDIGTEKMPKWISDYTGKKLEYVFTSGGEFPDDLSPYALIVHCGGCTLPPKEMRYRISQGQNQQIPITNYGVMIAKINGILLRVTEPFA